VGGRERTHVLSYPPHDASVQETATPISAASCAVGDQQGPEGCRATTAVFFKEYPFCCRSNIATPFTNPAYGLSEGVPLLPLTGLQQHIHDNQNNRDRGAIVYVTNSNKVELLDEGAGMTDSNCRQQDIEYLQPDGVQFSPVTHLSSMKAFIRIVRYYVPFVILLMEMFRPQRTKGEQTRHISKYDHERNRSEVLEVAAALDYVCKSVRKNCGSLLAWSP
jgi:hypothetical protein